MPIVADHQTLGGDRDHHFHEQRIARVRQRKIKCVSQDTLPIRFCDIGRVVRLSFVEAVRAAG